MKLADFGLAIEVEGDQQAWFGEWGVGWHGGEGHTLDDTCAQGEMAVWPSRAQGTQAAPSQPLGQGAVPYSLPQDLEIGTGTPPTR